MLHVNINIYVNICVNIYVNIYIYPSSYRCHDVCLSIFPGNEIFTILKVTGTGEENNCIFPKPYNYL